MPISYEEIPRDLLTPGAHIEFNNELAGANTILQKALILGQRKFIAGMMPMTEPVRVTQESQAVMLFGRGSMLALSIAAYLKANPYMELWAMASDDLVAGQFAQGTITVNTAPTGAGTAYIYLGGERVAVGVATGDDSDTVAASIAAAINANLDLPVTAATSASEVTVTASHKGEVLNGFDLRASYYDEALPAGLALTFASLSGGSGNPSIEPMIDAMGDEWFNWIVNPYTDTANVITLQLELASRYAAMRQIGCRAFSAFAGTHGQTGTFGSQYNHEHMTILGISSSPTPPFIAAAINAAVACQSLSIDPARPLQTLELPGMLAPIKSERWSRQERNLLLRDGISTFTVDRDGTCRIERQITTYQTNSAGLPDSSYLDICTPETLERIRFEQRALQAQKYPRHKLAEDGINVGAGQAIITPKIWRGELLALYKELERRGWVEDYATYEQTLIVEIDADDKNRLNWRDTPNLVNQARVFAGKQQFII